MNSHLNIFKFFNENTGEEFLENNLSRAFSICLTNNSLLLNEYLQAILSEEDYNYLFSSISHDTKYLINLQVDTAPIEKEGFKTIYAIAMTSHRGLNMDDFLSQTINADKKNITDIFISIKDIAIIIEVKRTNEDCKAQLFNQVLPFISEQTSQVKYEIKPKSYSWQEAISLMERVKHLQQLLGHHSVFINDFIEFSQLRYPQWFEPKPFNVIPFSFEAGSPNYIQLENRMRQAITGITSRIGEEYSLLPYSDRLGISVPFEWASELIPQFSSYSDATKNYIVFNIWPANTKKQGYSIYNKSLDWIHKRVIGIGGNEFELEIAYEVKLSHFNRYVSSINFTDENIVLPTHTSDNFYKKSGKIDRRLWENLEHFFDSHFKEEFEWRKNCEWLNKFINTDRNYLTMSLGFTVHAFIPFSVFTGIDRTQDDIGNLTAYLIQIIEAFKSLTD